MQNSGNNYSGDLLDEINKFREKEATVIEPGPFREGVDDTLHPPLLSHKLKVLEGINTGSTFQLMNDNFFIGNHILGRNPEYCEIVIDDNEVSKQHLEISIHSNSVYVRDLGSKNGTKVNGKKLKKKKELRNGDIISIGTTVLQFFPAPNGAAQTLISPSLPKKAGNEAVFELPKIHSRLIIMSVFAVVFAFFLVLLFFGKEKSELTSLNNEYSLEVSQEDRVAAKKNLEIALAQFKKNNYAEATAEFENAFESNPALKKDHKAQYAEALLKESMENYPKDLDVALASIIKAVKMDSDNYKSQYQLGRVYAKLREYDKAGKAYEKSIRLYDRFPDSYFNHAYILSLEGLYQEAIKKYEKIIPLRPQYLDEVYVNLALCYLRIASIDKALQYADKALAEDPQNKRALSLIEQYGRER